MKKLSFALKISLVIALVAVVGCQDRSNITEPMPPTLNNGLGLPGVTLDSAMFRVYVFTATNQVINVHRITSAWTEMGVTYDNFGSAFDPTIVGSFTANAVGWQSVDVTSLVQQWIDSANSNYGLLLEQLTSPLTNFPSSDRLAASIRPMLKICYTTVAGSECVTIQRGLYGTAFDSHINQASPFSNFGANDEMYVGVINDLYKYSLFQFSMPDFPQTAAIGDFVWNDTNMNGIQDAGEPGVAEVTVNLLDCAGIILATTATDANGLYLFSGLQPGNYNVQFVLPTGFVFSPQDQGGNDATDSDADLTTGQAICTELVGDETDLTWDAGIYVPVVPPASIGDFVWFDDNRNGIQDLGELGIGNATVELMDCAGNVLGTETTDENGFYLFDGLTPGNYNIHFVLPMGLLISPQDQGADDALDSDADPLAGLTICTELVSGENDMTWDLGLNTPDEHCTRTIGYWKTHDGSGPQDDVVTALLPIWLGTDGGAKSINVTNTTISHRLLDLSDAYYGPASNGISKLYAQLLGAKLNAENDADITMIAAVIVAADAFLATHDWNDWTGLTRSQKNMVLGWMETLDDYNNGLIGPIHCD